MAAAHLSDFRVGVRYAEKARQGLIQALSHGDRSEVVLAGFICMSWAEIWLHGVHNGVEYIRYASRLIKSAASSTSSDTVESMNVLSGTSLVCGAYALFSADTYMLIVHGRVRITVRSYTTRKRGLASYGGVSGAR